MFWAEKYIDAAYLWVCQKRKDYHFNNEVWHLRVHWQEERAQLLHDLKAQRFSFDLVKKISTADRTTFLWTAKDALVLKIMALHLEKKIKPTLSGQIYHLKAEAGQEKRGSKKAVKKVFEQLPNHTFVCRTDVKGYYANIQHDLLLQQLRPYVVCPYLMNLLKKFLAHAINDKGYILTCKQGIPLGSPLSPLLGALFLKPLDENIAALKEVYYLRFMDDWVLLAPTRWKLKKAIAVMNKTLNGLQLQKHPDKTSIGRITAGFDFLGHHLSIEEEAVAPSCPLEERLEEFPALLQKVIKKQIFKPLILIRSITAVQHSKRCCHLTLAAKTIQNFLDKCTRLYEQYACLVRMSTYVRCWFAWGVLFSSN